MKIQGLQKLTLLDYPGKLACTVFIGGCNFRCPFCHNADLVLPTGYLYEIPREELFNFLNKRQGVLEGVCITGGEPLLHPELPEFIRKIKELDYAVKLDTNGSFPERLEQLIQEQLIDYVAMDIKNAPGRYGETVGISNFDTAPIQQSITLLLEGRVPYEFRTTVVKEFHQEADFVQIGQWIQGAKQYFLQGFIDSGNLIKSGLHGCSKGEMEQLQAVVQPYVEFTEIRGM